jgi:Fe-S cluster biogenesis protein NfuA
MLFEEEEVIKKIEIAVDSLKPGFATNGGDINFVSYEHGTVHLHVVGSYIGYPSDIRATTEMIERQLRMIAPEVERVECF